MLFCQITHQFLGKTDVLLPFFRFCAALLLLPAASQPAWPADIPVVQPEHRQHHHRQRAEPVPKDENEEAWDWSVAGSWGW